jgi:hypothetical protein
MPTHAHNRPRTRPIEADKDRRWSAWPPLAATAVAALAAATLVTGCGGGTGPSTAGSGSGRGAGRSVSGGVMGQALAYSACMRSHGLPDFPAPTAGPGGGYAFQISGGPGSDLDRSGARFRAADRSCGPLLPGGGPSPRPASAPRLAAEVKWAVCMRAHGVVGFPDPNAQGAFDSSRFDQSTPTFQRASAACEPVQPGGAVAVVPGHGPGPG